MGASRMAHLHVHYKEHRSIRGRERERAEQKASVFRSKHKIRNSSVKLCLSYKFQVMYTNLQKISENEIQRKKRDRGVSVSMQSSNLVF